MAFVGPPPMFRPAAAEVSEIRVSCTFTWDRAAAGRLAAAWAALYPAARVSVGGPAFGTPAGDFTPGLYTRAGITITSRGCPNRCGFCLVPSREGPLRVLPIRPGYIVQDNNLLACPPDHVAAVFAMLGEQGRRVSFPGGLEAARVTPEVARRLAAVPIGIIYTAYDRPPERPHVARAVDLIRQATGWADGTTRKRITCYALIGYEGDTLTAAASRLDWLLSIHVRPFPMFYKPAESAGRRMPDEWYRLARAYLTMRRRRRSTEAAAALFGGDE